MQVHECKYCASTRMQIQCKHASETPHQANHKPKYMLGNTENLQWVFTLWFTLFTFTRIYARIVSNFLFLISFPLIVWSLIASHYQLVVFLIFQSDSRVKVNIIINPLITQFVGCFGEFFKCVWPFLGIAVKGLIK